MVIGFWSLGGYIIVDLPPDIPLTPGSGQMPAEAGPIMAHHGAGVNFKEVGQLLAGEKRFWFLVAPHEN
jgi:hypothetical protein